MKRLIIAEEEKRRILGLYNRFLINEQDDDYIDPNSVFTFNDTLCGDNNYITITNYSKFGNNIINGSLNCDKDNSKFTINFEFKIKNTKIIVYSWFKYTNNKIIKKEYDSFLEFIKLIDLNQYNNLPNSIGEILKTLNTTKYNFESFHIFTNVVDDKITFFLEKNEDKNHTPNEELIITNNTLDSKIEVYTRSNYRTNYYIFTIKDGEFIFTPIDSTETKTSTETKASTKPNTSKEPTKTDENIVTNFDRKYDYKKDGDKYYYRLKSKPDNWIEATDDTAKSSIATLVFKEKSGCVFPNQADACPNYNGVNWNLNPDVIDGSVNNDTNIGFCSKKYCTVKYIQDSINLIIDDDTKKGHKKLKRYPKLTVDGKFGQNTQNYIYALLDKVSATPREIYDLYQDA